MTINDVWAQFHADFQRLWFLRFTNYQDSVRGSKNAEIDSVQMHTSN